MLSTARLALRRSAAITKAPAATALQGVRNNSNTTHDPSKSISSSTSSTKSSEDSTSKEVLAAEAQAEADRALTQHRAEGDHIAAAAVSGAPTELTRRPVRIYQPSQESTQSAKATSWHWRIDWDTLPGAGRWENGLMGWASSADYVQGTHLKFKTKQDAINFAEKQGYPYFVSEPQHARIPPKSYSDNFLYSPGKLRYIRTK